MAELTQARLRELLHYDADTGLFTWRVRTAHRVQVGNVAGSPHGKHWGIRVGGRMYLAHRLAWLYVTGAFPAEFIDHINTVGTDNRFVNLREATRKLNAENIRRANSNCKLGLLGVSKNGRRFAARITVGGRQHHLGQFDTPEEAHTAYVKAKRGLHEGCTI